MRKDPYMFSIYYPNHMCTVYTYIVNEFNDDKNDNILLDGVDHNPVLRPGNPLLPGVPLLDKQIGTQIRRLQQQFRQLMLRTPFMSSSKSL